VGSRLGPPSTIWSLQNHLSDVTADLAVRYTMQPRRHEACVHAAWQRCIFDDVSPTITGLAGLPGIMLQNW
jgi:hypothetical protein